MGQREAWTYAKDESSAVGRCAVSGIDLLSSIVLSFRVVMPMPEDQRTPYSHLDYMGSSGFGEGLKDNL